MSYISEAITALQSSEIGKILNGVNELRERVDIIHSPDFQNCLSVLFPFMKDIILNRVPVQFIDNDENKTRHTVLEIISKFPAAPNYEVLKPFVLEILTMSVKVLMEDNEENALVAIRIIFDLHKTFKPALESQVQSFLDFVLKAYRNLAASMKVAFALSFQAQQPQSEQMSLLGPDGSMRLSGGNQANPLLKSVESFKVLTECPLIVMLLFQIYPKYIKSNIHQMVPYMMNTLGQKAPRMAAKLQRPRYKDLVAAQAKTLSFLTYLIRGNSDVMKQFDDAIAKCVISLLQTCPPEAVATRKELLVATRQIIYTDFRKGFHPFIDDLMNERLLLGSGKHAHSTLRPLAYSTIADLVQHVKESLSATQLSRVISLSARNMHDSELSISVQTTSVKLILSLVEKICSTYTMVPDGRVLLVIIFQTLVDKFDSLRQLSYKFGKYEEFLASDLHVIESGASSFLETLPVVPAPSGLGLHKEGPYLSETDKSSAVDPSAGSKSLVDEHPILNMRSSDKSDRQEYLPSVTKSLSIALFKGMTPVHNISKDIKQLVKTLLWGLKQIIVQLGTMRISPNCVSFGPSERKYLNRHFRLGLECIRIYVSSPKSITGKLVNDLTSDSKKSSDKKKKPDTERTVSETDLKDDGETKEFLELFCAPYLGIDTRFIRLVLENNLDMIVELAIQDSVYLNVLQNFLSNSALTKSTMDILLIYLISKLSHLAHPITNTHPKSSASLGQRSSILLKVFKMVFSCISTFPENEKILRPRLQKIIRLCLRYAHESRVSVNYYVVLRTLFRAMSGGKFEQSYQEVSLIIPTLLTGLVRLLERTEHETVRNVIIELCLSMPARLQSLTPHLPHLLTLLIRALNAKGEFPNIALRTFEFWIENLTTDHLFEVITAKQGLYDELMRGICFHLKPAPYPYGMLALRILGKMGGRNRAFLREAQMSDFVAPRVASEEYGKFCAMFTAQLVQKEYGPLATDLSDFMAASCNLLNCVSLKPPIEAEVLSLLASYYPDYPDGNFVNMSDRSSHLPLDSTLGELLRAISERGSTHDDGLMAKATEILTRDSNYVNESCLNSLKVAAIRLVILGLSKTSYFRAVSLTPVNDKNCVVNLNKLANSDSSHSPSEDRFCISLLFALIVSSIDGCLRENSLQLLVGICRHFQVLLRSKCEQIPSQRIYCVVHTAAFHALSDTRAAVYRVGSEFLQIWLKMGLVSDRLDAVDEIAPEVVGEQIHMDLDRESKEHTDEWIFADELVADILNIADLSSISTCNRKRVGSLRLLDELFKYLPHCSHIFRNFEIDIYRILFNLFERLESENLTIFSEDGFGILQSAIRYFCPSNVEDSDFATFNKDTVIFLLREIKHPSTIVRVLSEWCLQEIARRAKRHMKDFLSDQKIDTINEIFLHQIDALTTQDAIEDIGVISAFSFILSYDAPNLAVDERALKTLDLVMEATEILDISIEDPLAGVRCEINASLSFMDSRCILEASLFPGRIPSSVNLRLCCLRFINSLFLNSSELIFSDSFIDLRKRVFFILFKSLTLPWIEVINDAHKALAAAVSRVRSSSIPSDVSLPKEVIQDCFKPIMSTIHDYKQLSIPVLKGLEAVLKLFTNRAYVQIGDKFIEHLKHILDNDAYLSLAPQSDGLFPGEEQVIFAAMINIFHVLPWNSSSIGQNEFTLPREELSKFTIEFLFIVIRLENSRHCHQHQASLDSPYIPPLIRFFSRYSLETVRLILQPIHIYQEEVLQILIAVINVCKETEPFLNALVSIDGCNSLMKLLDCGIVLARPLDEHQVAIGSSKIDVQIGETSPRKKLKTMSDQDTSSIGNDSSLLDTEQAKIVRDHTVRLVHSLFVKHPGLFLERPNLYLRLKDQWLLVTSEMSTEDSSSNSFRSIESLFSKQRTSVYLSECLVGHCRVVKDDVSSVVDALLTIVHVFKISQSFEFSSVTHFLSNEVPKILSNIAKQTLIRIFFQLINNPNYPSEIKVKSLQILILPLLMDSFEQSRETGVQLIDIDTVKVIMQEGMGMSSDKNPTLHNVDQQAIESVGSMATNFVGTESSTSGSSAVDTVTTASIPGNNVSVSSPVSLNGPSDTRDLAESNPNRNPTNRGFTSVNSPVMRILPDNLKVELLKVATLMIEYLGRELVEHRKDLIKFAWNHLKADDSNVKNWAYINVCRFIAVYETPPKIITQVYVALLRAHQPECRDLVRLAVDILIPSLHRRLTPSEYVKAMKWTKKILSDDGHTVQQMLHIWNIIIRHSDFFYPYRNLFLPHMVQSLSRLGLGNSCPPEHRQISVGVTDVILAWESYRQRSREVGGVFQHTNLPDTTNGHFLGNKDDEYSLQPNLIQLVANFLIRIGLVAASDKEPLVSHLTNPCMALFSKLITLHSLASIKLAQLEKLTINIIENFQAQEKSKPKIAFLSSHTHQDSLKSSIGGSSQPMQRQNSSSVNATAPNSGFTSENVILVLANFLTTVISKVDSPNLPFIQGFVTVKDFLPVWMSCEGSQAQSKLRDFVLQVFSRFPMSYQTDDPANFGFYCSLRDLIDRGFQTCINDLDPRNRVENLSVLNESLVNTNNILLLFDTICFRVPAWADNHGSSLVKLCLNLLAEQLRQANTSQRSGHQALLMSLQEHGQDFDASKVSPTLHMAVVSESTTSNTVLNSSSEALGSALFLSLSNALRALQKGYLEQYKHSIFNIVITILENSDNSLLLNLIMSYLFQWISASSGPFTLREQHQIISKLCAFDKVQEFQLMPLFIRLVMLVEKSLSSASVKPTISKAQSMFKHLEIIGLLSPIDSLRVQAQNRLRSKWGISALEVFIGILNSDCSPFVSRYWISCLPSMFFSCARDNVEYFYSCGNDVDPEGVQVPKYTDKDNLYVQFLTYVSSISENSSLILNSLSVVAFTNMECVQSTMRTWIEAIWKLSDDIKRMSITSSLMENTLRTKYKQSLSFPAHATSFLRSVRSRLSPSIISDLFELDLSYRRKANDVIINVPKEFLRFISHLHPLPVLPEEYLCALSRNYSTAFESLGFLAAIHSSKDHYLKTTYHLLSNDIEDEDGSLIFLNGNCINMASKLAFSFELYGHYEEAQGIYYNAMKSYNNTMFSLCDKQLSEIKGFELEMWEHRWVEVSRKLSHWQLLSHYAKELNIVSLNMESAVMTSDWTKVKDMRKYPSIVASLERGVSKSKLTDIMLSVVENNSTEADKLCAQSVQMALIRWHQLPHMYPSSVAHKRLFNEFHQIMELRESVSLMNEVLKCHSQRTTPDLRGMMKAWRQRLPNEWEDLRDWESILVWRNHVFRNIQKLLDQGTASRVGDIGSDICWTSLKLASIASKRNLISASNKIIDGLDVDKLGSIEKFGIVKQKLLNYSRIGKGYEGLEFITRQSMEVYDEEQMAQIVRLKSLLQHNISENQEEIQKSLSLCVQLQNSYGKGWLTWGQILLKLIESEPSSTMIQLNVVSACVCVLKAIDCNLVKARFEVPKVLLILSLNLNSLKTNVGELSLSFLKSEASVWLPYVQFLYLVSKNLQFLKDLLVKMALQYPQFMMSELLDQRMHESNYIYEAITSKYWRLCGRLNSFNVGAVADLRPGKLEETAQELQEVYFQTCEQLDTRLTETVGTSLIQRINAIFSSKLTGQLSTSSPEFGKIRMLYEECNTRLSDQSFVSECLVLIINWIELLKKCTVCDTNFRCPSFSRLYFGTSRCFEVNASNEHVEIPGFYRHILNAPRVNLHPLICKIGLLFVPVEYNLEFTRQIHILGNDGIEYCFLMRKIDSSIISDNEGISSKVFEFLDLSLKNHPQSRSRDLSLTHPSAVFVGKNHELVRCDSAMTSLLSLYSDECSKRTEFKSKYHDVFFARQKFEEVSSINSSISSKECLNEAFKAACTKVPEDIVSTKISSFFSTAEAQYIYYREFSSQLGVVSAVQFLLGSSTLGPQQFNFEFESGRIILLSLLHSSRLNLQRGARRDVSKIPFRLTRSLKSPINNDLLRGILKLRLGLCFDAFANFREVLEKVLVVELTDSVDTPQIGRLSDVSRSLISNMVSVSPSFFVEKKIVPDLAASDNATIDVKEIDSCLSDLLLQATKENNYIELGFQFYAWV